jgi:hypothetical protein
METGACTDTSFNCYEIIKSAILLAKLISQKNNFKLVLNPQATGRKWCYQNSECIYMDIQILCKR